LSGNARVEVVIEANAVAFSVAFTTQFYVIHAIVDARIIALGANILVITARQRSAINLRTSLRNRSNLSGNAIIQVIVVANAVAFTVTFTAKLHSVYAVVDACVVALRTNINVIAARERSTVNLSTRLRLRKGGNMSIEAVVKFIVEANAIAFPIAFAAELHAIYTVVQFGLVYTFRSSIYVITTLARTS